MAVNALPKVPLAWADVPTWVRKIAEAVNNLADGRSNSVTTLTLAAGAATTTLTNQLIQVNSHITLEPTTTNAAVAKQTTYRSSVTTGSAVYTHTNNGQTDRTFTVEIRG